MASKRQSIAMGSDERTLVTDIIVEDLRASGHDVGLFGALADDDPEWPNVARKWPRASRPPITTRGC